MGDCLSRIADVNIVSGCPPSFYSPYVNGLKRRIFYKWQIEVLKQKHKREHVQTSMRLAELHQRLLNQEDTIANAVRILHTQIPERVAGCNEDVHCVVCLNTVSSLQCVTCSEGHQTCVTCLDTLCNARFAKNQSSEVLCPSPTDCSALLTSADLCRTLGGRALNAELQHRKTIDLALDVFQKYSLDDARMKLRYMRHDCTFAAYECSECQFGPIEHMHCEDLTEWHNREGHHNSCPCCGHFVTSTDLLRRWSGQIRPVTNNFMTE